MSIKELRCYFRVLVERSFFLLPLWSTFLLCVVLLAALYHSQEPPSFWSSLLACLQHFFGVGREIPTSCVGEACLLAVAFLGYLFIGVVVWLAYKSLLDVWQ